MQGISSGGAVKAKGRPAIITFKDYNKETKEVSLVEAKAHFHCWGVRKPKSQEPGVYGLETVGVCELESGHVRLVYPEKIKFIDNKNNMEVKDASPES